MVVDSTTGLEITEVHGNVLPGVAMWRDPSVCLPVSSVVVLGKESAERKPTAADDPPKPSERFEEFWQRYPQKIGKDEACRAYVSVVTLANEAEMFAELERYEASDEWARGVYQRAANWLYRGSRCGWSDMPAPVVQRNGRRELRDLKAEDLV